MKQKIVLATSSPYRIKSFEHLNIDFMSVPSKVDEQSIDRPNTARKLALFLAKIKAEDVARELTDEIVLGFDSVGEFNKQILEKPKSRKEAFEGLRKLSGNIMNFYTGVYLINLKSGSRISEVVKTKCYMRHYSSNEINKYLDQDDKYKTYAIGFNPNNFYSATFIRRVEGSITNLTKGVPLETVIEMIKSS